MLGCVVSHCVKVPCFSVYSWLVFSAGRLQLHHDEHSRLCLSGLSPEVEPLGHGSATALIFLDATKLMLRGFLASCAQLAMCEHSRGSVSQPTLGVVSSYGLFPWCWFSPHFCLPLLCVKGIHCVSFHCWLGMLRTFPKVVGHWDNLFCEVFTQIFAHLSKKLLSFSHWL